MYKELSVFAEVDGFVCPAAFWPALGYDGDARFVAIWWEQCGDEAAYDDGRASLVGAWWPAYEMLVGHNFPLGHPARWLLGGSDVAATMKLLIERPTERAWLVPVEEAHNLLRMQWPAVDAAEDGIGVVLSMDEWQALIKRLAAIRSAMPGQDLFDSTAVLARQVGQDGALAAALAARPKSGEKMAL